MSQFPGQMQQQGMAPQQFPGLQQQGMAPQQQFAGAAPQGMMQQFPGLQQQGLMQQGMPQPQFPGMAPQQFAGAAPQPSSNPLGTIASKLTPHIEGIISGIVLESISRGLTQDGHTVYSKERLAAMCEINLGFQAPHAEAPAKSTSGPSLGPGEIRCQHFINKGASNERQCESKAVVGQTCCSKHKSSAANRATTVGPRLGFPQGGFPGMMQQGMAPQGGFPGAPPLMAGIPQGMPQQGGFPGQMRPTGFPQQGIPQGLPQGLQQQGIPQGLPQGLQQQGLPQGLQQQGLPQGLQQQLPQQQGIQQFSHIQPQQQQLPQQQGLPQGLQQQGLPQGLQQQGLPQGLQQQGLPQGLQQQLPQQQGLPQGLQQQLPQQQGLPQGLQQQGIQQFSHIQPQQQQLPQQQGLQQHIPQGLPQQSQVTQVQLDAKFHPLAQSDPRFGNFHIVNGGSLKDYVIGTRQNQVGGLERVVVGKINEQDGLSIRPLNDAEKSAWMTSGSGIAIDSNGVELIAAQHSQAAAPQSIQTVEHTTPTQQEAVGSGQSQPVEIS